MAELFYKQTMEGSQNGSSKAPYFFTVILSSEPKLRIPKKFVKKYGHNFPGIVSLETRSGPTWQVELSRINDEVWLEKGFQEFKEYYSIDLGYFLVFRYDENFYFHVLIYDKSACEIDYPSSAPEQNHQNNIDESCNSREISVDINDSDKEVSVEVLDDFSTKRSAKRKKQTLNGSSMMKMPEKMREKIVTQKTDAIAPNLKPEIKKENKVGTRSRPLFPISSSKKIVKGKEKQKCIAYQRAIAFKSNNPFFVSFIQRSYVSAAFGLTIGKAFAQKYLTCKNYCDVVLCGPDGRTWKVKFYTGKKYAYAKLQWKKFVQDNFLRVGDACVFERENDTRYPLLNVLIFRTNEDTEMPENFRSWERKMDKSCVALPNDRSTHKRVMLDTEHIDTNLPLRRGVERKCNEEKRSTSSFIDSRRKQTDIEKENSIAYQRAKAFKSKNPFFIAFMRPVYLSQQFKLSIPKTFAQKYLSDEKHCDVVLRVSDGRTWKVKSYIYGYNGALLWKNFALDNGLRIGDACVFVREKDTACPFLNVIIFRTEMPENFGSHENMTAKTSVALPNEQLKRIRYNRMKLDPEQTNATPPYLKPDSRSKQTVVEKENVTAYQRAKAFKSNNPFFVSCVQPIYLSRFDLTISTTFAQKYLSDEKTCDVVLRVSDGRTWKVKCYIGYKGVLYWKEFALDNDLRVGDACVFERENDTKRPFLNVIIFRTMEDEEDCLVKNPNFVTEISDNFRCQEKRDTVQPYLKRKIKSKRSRLQCPVSSVIEKGKLLLTYQRANCFKSDNPFIILYMQPSYVFNNLCISKKFAQNYLADEKKFDVVLRVPDGKTWKVKCYTGLMNTKIGWKKFVQDNGLYVGDVCVFERENWYKSPFLNVTIFRTSEDWGRLC